MIETKNITLVIKYSLNKFLDVDLDKFRAKIKKHYSTLYIKYKLRLIVFVLGVDISLINC